MKNITTYTYYTNGINEKRIKNNENVPQGWTKGRLKSPVTTKGTIKINNGVIEKHIPVEEKIPDGWKKGRLKSNLNPKKQSRTLKEKYKTGELINPNKGKIMSQCQKEKLRKSHLGKHHSTETKKKISEHSNNNRKKAYQTIIERYSSLEDYYKMINTKSNKTKIKNNSFNTSKPEQELRKELYEKYGKDDVISNYKSDDYPFHCDFYIKSEDLYIELNAHWTHGYRPFNENDEECKKLLKIWKNKAKTSKFYENAIYTWTVRDVEKLNTAIKNKINYKVIY